MDVKEKANAKTCGQTFESMLRELLNCPEDMLRPTSKAALRSLSACNCSCNLETYIIHMPRNVFKKTNMHLSAHKVFDEMFCFLFKKEQENNEQNEIIIPYPHK